MSIYRVKGNIPEGDDFMKTIRKNRDPNKKHKRITALGKGATVLTVAAVVSSSLIGCDDKTNSSSVETSDSVAEITVSVNGSDPVPSTSVTPTPKPTKTPSASETTVSPTPAQTGDTTAATGTKTNTPTPTPKPSGNTSGGGSTTKTNTPTPTPKPAAKADPYDDCCDCPDCGSSGGVSYHSAKTIHHNAETHTETTVTYDRIVKTFRYTERWHGNFIEWCNSNGYSVPSEPSTTAKVIYDGDENVIDASAEYSAVADLGDEAYEIASALGYTDVPSGYTVECIDVSYEGEHRNEYVVVDKEAWDETIPAGWYCDDCDYYSSSVPKEYDDIDI